MDKKIILELLTQNVEKNKTKYSQEDLDLLDAIKETIIELEVARSMFNTVSDPQLINLAMYAEDLAKTRYDYLINMAKKRELKCINWI